MRWILVLPAAVGAYFSVQIAITLVNLLQDFFWSMGSERWTQLINSIAGPAAFVWCGTKTAPKYRANVSIILATASSCVLIGLVVFMFCKARTYDFEFWWIVISASAGVFGAIASAAYIHSEEASLQRDREYEINRLKEMDENRLKEISKN